MRKGVILDYMASVFDFIYKNNISIKTIDDTENAIDIIIVPRSHLASYWNKSIHNAPKNSIHDKITSLSVIIVGLK